MEELTEREVITVREVKRRIEREIKRAVCEGKWVQKARMSVWEVVWRLRVMRWRKKAAHQLLLRLLLLWDRHCRSHNIAAECCVRSKSASCPCFELCSSKIGGRLAANVVSIGSDFIVTLVSKRSSAMLVAGLAWASTEPRDSTSEGAGVLALA